MGGSYPLRQGQYGPARNREFRFPGGSGAWLPRARRPLHPSQSQPNWWWCSSSSHLPVIFSPGVERKCVPIFDGSSIEKKPRKRPLRYFSSSFDQRSIQTVIVLIYHAPGRKIASTSLNTGLHHLSPFCFILLVGGKNLAF